jgi:chromosome segregation ATPase
MPGYRTSRLLIVCALALAFLPLAVHAQSLGEVARQLREQRQQSGVRQTKVYTNDDFEKPGEVMEGGAADANAPSQGAAETAKAGEDESKDETKDKTKEDKKTLEEELKEQQEEVNQKYSKLLGDLRGDIAKTQDELQNLRHDQMISTNQFRSSNGTSPNVYEYDDQQAMFDKQIESATRKLEELNAQLDDAREEARRAGYRESE